MPSEPISWKRVGIALLIVLLGVPGTLLVLVLILSPVWNHYSTWRAAKSMLDDPLTKFVPITPLPTNDRTPAATLDNVEAFGWQIGVPNTHLKSRTDRGTILGLTFENGSTMWIDSKQFPDQDFRNALHQEGYLTTEEANSPLAYSMAAFNNPVSEVSFWHSRKRNYRALLLMTQRSLIFLEPTAIHPVEAPGLSGLEGASARYGKTQYELLLEDSVHHSLQIRFWAPASETQADVNTLIASVKPPQ